MTTFVLTNQIIGEYDNEQAIQHLQGGTRLGVLRLAKRLRRLPVGVLYEGHAAAENGHEIVDALTGARQCIDGASSMHR